MTAEQKYTSYFELTIPPVRQPAVVSSHPIDDAAGDPVDRLIDQESAVVTPNVSGRVSPAISTGGTSDASTLSLQPEATDSANDESTPSEPELFHAQPAKCHQVFEAFPEDHAGPYYNSNHHHNHIPYDYIPFVDEDPEPAYEGHISYSGPGFPVGHSFVPVRYVDTGYCIYENSGPGPAPAMSHNGTPQEFRGNATGQIVSGNRIYESTSTNQRGHVSDIKCQTRPYCRSPSPNFYRINRNIRDRVMNDSGGRRGLESAMHRSYSSPGSFREPRMQRSVTSPLAQQLYKGHVQSNGECSTSLSNQDFKTHRYTKSPVSTDDRQRLVQSPTYSNESFVRRSSLSPVLSNTGSLPRSVISPNSRREVPPSSSASSKFPNNFHVNQCDSFVQCVSPASTQGSYVQRSPMSSVSGNFESHSRIVNSPMCVHGHSQMSNVNSDARRFVHNSTSNDVNRSVVSPVSSHHSNVDRTVISPFRRCEISGTCSPVSTISSHYSNNQRSVMSPRLKAENGIQPDLVTFIDHSNENFPRRSRRSQSLDYSGQQEFIGVTSVINRKPPPPIIIAGRPPAPPPRDPDTINKYGETHQYLIHQLLQQVFIYSFIIHLFLQTFVFIIVILGYENNI